MPRSPGRGARNHQRGGPRRQLVADGLTSDRVAGSLLRVPIAAHPEDEGPRQMYMPPLTPIT